jgi:multimeric flavodoxin WrbA
MIKVLGIAASPRRGGNSDLLLDEVLRGTTEDGAADVEKIIVSSLKIAPCNECNSCSTTGKCIIKDDMQVIYQKLFEADRIILATPVFFATVSTHAKILIDRCQALWARKYLLGQTLEKKDSAVKRVGMLISVAAAKGPTVFDCVKKTVKYFYLAIGADYKHNLLYSNIEEKGSIKKHHSALKDAFEKGKELIGEGSSII